MPHLFIIATYFLKEFVDEVTGEEMPVRCIDFFI